MNEQLLDERVDDLAVLLDASAEQGGLFPDDMSGFEELHVSATTPEVWLG